MITYHIGSLCADIATTLGRRKRVLVAPTSGDTLLIYCFGNDEQLIIRYVRRYWNLILISRLTYTAPIYELKFRWQS